MTDEETIYDETFWQVDTDGDVVDYDQEVYRLVVTDAPVVRLVRETGTGAELESFKIPLLAAMKFSMAVEDMYNALTETDTYQQAVRFAEEHHD